MKAILKFWKFFFTIIIFSCASGDDDSNVTPLPDGVIIEIINKNLSQGSVTLVASQTNGNQTGTWSILSDNITIGQFESTTNSTTRFTGSILEFYNLSWTINNGEETISQNKTILMCQGESIDDVVNAERDIAKLILLVRANVFTFEQLHAGGGQISIEELIANGATITELLEEQSNYIGYYDLYEGGVTISQMLEEGLSLQEIFDGFYLPDYNPNWTNIPPYFRYFLDEDIGVEVADLISLGATVPELYIGGVTIQEILENNLSIKEIIFDDRELAGILDLISENNISVQQLIDQDILKETTTEGLYVFKYILNVYNPSLADQPLETLNYVYPDIGGLWRLPTLVELELIYEERETLDLRIDLISLPTLWESIYVSSDEQSCYVDIGLILDLRYGIDFRNGETYSCMGYQTYTQTFSLPVIQL